MDWLVIPIQWLHVLLGILWFGHSLSLAVFIIPALNRLPITTQREIGTQIGARTTPILKVVVPVIIILGIIRGTVFGPVKSLEFALTTAYGLTWIVAIIATTATYIWGMTVIDRAVQAMNAAPLNPDGSATPELVAAADRAKRVVVLELFGFLVIFTSMILMRFGL